jgi:hypothetical protein
MYVRIGNVKYVVVNPYDTKFQLECGTGIYTGETTKRFVRQVDQARLID